MRATDHANYDVQDTVRLYALMPGKAILMIGGSRYVLNTGQSTPDGFRLVYASSEYALVEKNGIEFRLEPGAVTEPVGMSSAYASPDETAGILVLWADPSGFFHADGKINGLPIRFLVDTGANAIAISSATARELGVDISAGRQGTAVTASGTARVVGVTLDSVSVGSITLRNIEAGVIEGDFPQVPLLGASFLRHIDMLRSGERMELKSK